MTVKRWICVTVIEDGEMRDASTSKWSGNDDLEYVLASDYDQLFAALKGYGRHTYECDASAYDDVPCTCGFAAWLQSSSMTGAKHEI